MLGNLPLPTTSGRKGIKKYSITKVGTISSVSALYILISTSAVFLNKLLFATSEYKFPYPFFTVLFQLCVTFIFMVLWSSCRPVHPMHIPRFSWDSSVAIRVAPLSIVYMCVIIFNPLFLRHVEATAYHFSHSLSIAFSLIFSFYMLKVEPSQNLTSACIVIMLGFCIGSMGQLNFSLAGVFYALAWPAVVAIYGIYVKKTIAALRNDVWLLIQYNTAMSIVTLIPLVLLSGELKEVLNNVWFLDEFGFWLQMVITSFTGFAVNVAMVYLLIHATPLTLAVASANKSIFQASIVAIVFGNSMSLLNAAGMLTALGGTLFYIYTKYSELYL